MTYDVSASAQSADNGPFNTIGGLAGPTLTPVGFSFAAIDPQTAGIPFNVVIRAVDGIGNTMSNFTGTVALTTTAGTITPANSAAFIGGIVTQQVTVTAAGPSQTITATASGKTGTSGAFSVVPGALSQFGFAAINTQSVGIPFNIIITALDGSGNAVNSFTGTVALTTTAGTITPTNSDAFVSGSITQQVSVTAAGASQTITAIGSGKTGTSSAFMTSALMMNITVTYTDFGEHDATHPGPERIFEYIFHHQGPGGECNAMLNASISLGNGNEFYAASQDGGFLDWTLILGPNSITVDGTGQDILYIGQIGKIIVYSSSHSIRYDVSASAQSADNGPFNTIGGLAGPTLTPVGFSFASIGPQTAGIPFNVVIRAVDGIGNTMSNFTGTVALTTTAGTITPANSATFIGGIVTQQVTVTAAGPSQTITATAGGKTGTSGAFSVGTSQVQIAGLVRYSNTSLGMPGLPVYLSGDDTQNQATASDGTYSFLVNASGHYQVTPSLVSDSRPGQWVTTADITLIRRHILAIAALDSPYKVLAGDVNNSSSLTTVDITLIRRMILGITNTYPAGLWTFVRSDMVFTNPMNPWPCESVRNYTNLANNSTGQDFVAVMHGDVNNSWTTGTTGLTTTNSGAGLMGLRKPPLASVVFHVGSHSVEEGNFLQVPILADGFKRVTSVQFSLHWDPKSLQYAGVAAFGLAGMDEQNFGTTQKERGQLAFSWDEALARGVTVPNGTRLFTVRFKVLKAGGQTTEVGFGDLPALREVTVDGAMAGFVAKNASLTLPNPDQAFALAVLPMVAASPDGNRVFSVAVPTESGKTYVLEGTESLTEWKVVTEVAGDGAVKVIADPMATDSHRFYRVRAVANSRRADK